MYSAGIRNQSAYYKNTLWIILYMCVYYDNIYLFAFEYTLFLSIICISIKFKVPVDYEI